MFVYINILYQHHLRYEPFINTDKLCVSELLLNIHRFTGVVCSSNHRLLSYSYGFMARVVSQSFLIIMLMFNYSYISYFEGAH